MANNTDFVSAVYQNMLLKPPTDFEKNYFVTRLDSGLTTQAQVVELALTHNELTAQANQLSKLYQAVFGRLPDVQSLAFWAGVQNSGASLQQIGQQMISSALFAATAGSALGYEAKVNGIYQNALGRAVNAQELAFWQHEAAIGGDLGLVLKTVVQFDVVAQKWNGLIDKLLVWHSLIGTEPTIAQLNALPNTDAELAVAMVKQTPSLLLQTGFWETGSIFYGNDSINNALSLNLIQNTLTVGSTTPILSSGSLASALHANMSGMKLSAGAKLDPTILQLVDFVGDSGDNQYIASALGDKIDAGAGNDTLTLGAGKDVVLFGNTPLSNGIDTIYAFTLGTDQLNFGRFLNKTTGNVNMINADASKNTQTIWNNGDVIVVQGNALTSPSSIASLFGAGKALAAPRNATKTVVISADLTGDASVWFVANSTNVNSIESSEVSLVATIKDVNNLLAQQTLASLLASTQVSSTLSGRLSYSSLEFNESASNDGSIANSVSISLANDSFVGAIGASIGSVSNVPKGLTAKLVKISNTEALLSLTGKAIEHSANNSISNLNIVFKNTSFTSGVAADGAISELITVAFRDVTLSEAGSVLSVSGNVPSALVIDLSKDTVTYNGKHIASIADTISTVNLMNISSIAPTGSIRVIGSATTDVIAAPSFASTLRGMGGYDGYLLGNAIDTVIFESSAATNGVDIISNFKVGDGGDKLDFSAFLNKTITTNIGTKLDSSTAASPWVNGSVLSVQGYSIDTPVEVAGLFGVGKTFAAPTAQAKAVVITSDLVGDAQIWYITNQATTGITSIDADEVELVGTLQGINNLSLVDFSASNFA